MRKNWFLRFWVHFFIENYGRACPAAGNRPFHPSLSGMNMIMTFILESIKSIWLLAVLLGML